MEMVKYQDSLMHIIIIHIIHIYGIHVFVWIGEGNLMVNLKIFYVTLLFYSQDCCHWETACSGAGGIGSSAGEVFCVAVFMCLCE